MAKADQMREVFSSLRGSGLSMRASKAARCKRRSYLCLPKTQSGPGGAENRGPLSPRR